VRLPRAAPDPGGKNRGAFEPPRKPADVPDPIPRDRGAAEPVIPPAARPDAAVPGKAAAEPARKPPRIPDPATPGHGAAGPARKPTVIPDPTVPDRGAFEPPPKLRAVGEPSSVSAGRRRTPELAATASASSGERSDLPPVPPSTPPAQAEPSWAAVLATTARLWIQRRPRGRDATGRRKRFPVLIAAVLVVAAIGALAFVLGRHGRKDQAGSQPSAAVATATAVRYQSAAWVARQVNRDAIIACDPVMCAALHSRGFPAASLLPIMPSRPDPLGAELVVATAAVREQFGARLATVYAPQVIARFGTGQARIEIRMIPAQGAAGFRSRLATEERAARKQGALILGNRKIKASPEASAALAAGHVDERILATLAALAQEHPVHVIAFGDANPGAGPGVPLRSVDLAGTDRAAGLRPAVYQHWLLGFLHAQRTEYLATSITAGRGASGRAVVNVEFAAPST
jgi:hypothetical protein